jgi:DeoR family glycerol-3-phosphate regulon repressor
MRFLLLDKEWQPYYTCVAQFCPFLREKSRTDAQMRNMHEELNNLRKVIVYMLPFERREKIMALLEAEKAITVESLASRLYVSGATLRRDLQLLEEEGCIRRTRGGALLPVQRVQDIPLYARRQERMQEKQAIARAASRFFAPGDTLILDASTSALALSEELKIMDSLTVVTSGLLTAQAFAVPGRQVLCTGGTLRENSASLTGEDAAVFLKSHHGTWTVFSCRGLTAEGVWESAPEEAALKRSMLDAGEKHMLLCDATKLNQYFLCRTGDLTRLHVLVTDKMPEGTLLAALHEANVRIVVA